MRPQRTPQALWDQVYPKLERDPRYQALSGKERRPAFDKYQQERAPAEKVAIIARKKKIKQDFLDL